MTTQLKQVLMQPNLLTPEIANSITSEIMKGNLGHSQIGAFLATLKLLGKESQPSYIASIAKSMRDAALKVETDYELVDIVGTGGDGQDTFNVSTAASIVAAGAGCKVAKVLYINLAWKQSQLFFLWLGRCVGSTWMQNSKCIARTMHKNTRQWKLLFLVCPSVSSFNEVFICA